MKICQVIASWEQGGLEKHVIELSNELSKQHQVFVIAHPLMRPHFVQEVNFVPIDFSQSRRSPKLYWQLFALLKQIAPDVIHAQANKAALLIKRLRPWLKFKTRYIATLHNQKGNTSMFEGFDKVIVVSPRLASLIKTSPTIAIYNGVRLPVQSDDGSQRSLAQEFGLDQNKPVFIAVGRLVTAKGFDILINAVAKAAAQVVIVGDGELKTQLQQQINTLHANVVLAGFRADVPRLMALSNGFILSSRHEGFAYVFVEALLSRCPIVTTAMPMVAEFMPSDLIVPIADVDALAHKLQWVQANAAEWQNMMQPYFEKAQQYLSLEAMVNLTRQVYLVSE